MRTKWFFPLNVYNTSPITSNHGFKSEEWSYRHHILSRALSSVWDEHFTTHASKFVRGKSNCSPIEQKRAFLFLNWGNLFIACLLFDSFESYLPIIAHCHVRRKIFECSIFTLNIELLCNYFFICFRISKFIEYWKFFSRF